VARLSFIQYRLVPGSVALAAVIDDHPPRRVAEFGSTYEFATWAERRGAGLAEAATELDLRETVDVDALLREGRLLSPVHHPDPAHLYVTGTGLTHLGSAEGRDAMHRAAADAPSQTDSMRMFLMGLEGGKPKNGAIGIQPEWFYKGNGDCVSGSGTPLVSPAFAQDAGEEPEIAGIYLIGRNGSPLRLGFCLANDFSDHVTERANYLWLSHSKLRPVSLGPELLTGALAEDVRGKSKIIRDNIAIWEKAFLSGEANMSHSIANLEHHHFKYEIFRKPGDVHVHLFGTATFSFSSGLKTLPGDVFEIEASPFRWPLRNELRLAESSAFDIRSL
jgi:hypothetical protein